MQVTGPSAVREFWLKPLSCYFGKHAEGKKKLKNNKKPPSKDI